MAPQKQPQTPQTPTQGQPPAQQHQGAGALQQRLDALRQHHQQQQAAPGAQHGLALPPDLVPLLLDLAGELVRFLQQHQAGQAPPAP